MFPGGIDKRQMAAMMRQMGIKNEEVDAVRVIIEKADGKKIIINDPSVTKIIMQGDISFQIGGRIEEGEGEKSQGNESEGEEESKGEIGAITEQDIAMVSEAAKVSKLEAKDALEKSNGDIAEAIMALEARKNK